MTGPTLRDYQQAAVDADADVDGDASQLHMACGSGKTLVALRIAERRAPGAALIVVAAPTVALVDQVLREWRAAADTPFAALAVCSDQAADSLVHLDELTVGATTSVDDVTAWLRSAAHTRRVIATTYLSAPVVAAALHGLGLVADLLVCDEAHHLTGSLIDPTRRILDRVVFPTRRRLFQTATPRVDLRSSAKLAASDTPIASMDDEAVFGSVASRYPFGQAVRDKVLSDYRLAVIGVTEHEARALLAADDVDYAGGVGEAPLAILATQAALVRARTEFGVRRAISFHPTIAAARQFARSMHRAADLLAPPDIADALTARHISGEMDLDQRRLTLDMLRHPPRGGWAVVSNARCLSEGVDIPAVDCVIFGHPKRSAVDIIQAVGRAMRRSSDGADVATIVVPIVVGDDPAEADIDPGTYKTLWNVVRALRAHDEELGIALDERQLRTKGVEDGSMGLPEKITIMLPPGTADHVLRQLRLLIADAGSDISRPWLDSLDSARAFHAEHGHLRVPVDHVTADGHRLGIWVRTQRTAVDRLSHARRAALDELGMMWDPFEEVWERMFDLAAAFRRQEGHLRIPISHQESGESLGAWLGTQRAKAAKGTLRDARRRRLEALGMATDPWQAGYAAAQRFHTEHGHLRVRQTYIDPTGYTLGTWIAHQRDRARGSGRRQPLDRDQAALLDKIDMVWNQGNEARDLTGPERAELRDLLGSGARKREVSALMLRLHEDGVGQGVLAEEIGITPSTVSARIANARRARDGSGTAS